MNTILPAFSSNAYKFLGLILYVHPLASRRLSLIYPDSIVPTVLMPLSLLSYASVIGILSTVFLVVVMLIDGVSKVDSPGSLWSPAPTSLSPGNYGELGLAFGLFMAGVSLV